MIDRLTLTADRIKSMADGIREVAELPDPVGRVISENDRRGMKIKKVSVFYPIPFFVVWEGKKNQCEKNLSPFGSKSCMFIKNVVL